MWAESAFKVRALEVSFVAMYKFPIGEDNINIWSTIIRGVLLYTIGQILTKHRMLYSNFQYWFRV